MSYEIVAVRYGTVRSQKSELFYRYQAYGEPDASQDMDFFFYVLRRGEEVIVIDTGFRPAAAAPRGRECLTPPAQALARLGIDPARVKRLLITHLHWDHIGNVELFEAAELFVPAAELEFWSAPISRNVQFWAHVDPEGVALIEGAWRAGRVAVTGEQQEIAPGLRTITVGGHSPGQQVLVVDTASGPVVLASDAVHLYEELELERPFSVMVNLREMYEGYALLKRLRTEGASIVPGHDPLVTERYPDLGGDAAGLAFQLA
ncbi:MAG TPA: N-acyl homoserine lactonase family protein [Solirubrobacteraceae bacterium]|nr:N-acyl homoserine lactonase family protein [Solirubrobacteraceae bacterium]